MEHSSQGYLVTSKCSLAPSLNGLGCLSSPTSLSHRSSLFWVQPSLHAFGLSFAAAWGSRLVALERSKVSRGPVSPLPLGKQWRHPTCVCVAGRRDGSNSTGIRDGSVNLGPAVFEASSHGAFWLMAQRMRLSKLLVGGMKMTTQVTVARRQIKTYEGGPWKGQRIPSALRLWTRLLQASCPMWLPCIWHSGRRGTSRGACASLSVSPLRKAEAPIKPASLPGPQCSP